MKLFGKKTCLYGCSKYYFFGVPFLCKERTETHVKTYLFGIRTSTRKLKVRR